MGVAAVFVVVAVVGFFRLRSSGKTGDGVVFIIGIIVFGLVVTTLIVGFLPTRLEEVRSRDLVIIPSSSNQDGAFILETEMSPRSKKLYYVYHYVTESGYQTAQIETDHASIVLQDRNDAEIVWYDQQFANSDYSWLGFDFLFADVAKIYLPEDSVLEELPSSS